MPKKPLNLKAIYGSYDNKWAFEYPIEKEFEDEITNDNQNQSKLSVGNLYIRALKMIHKAKTKDEILHIVKIYKYIISEKEAFEIWEKYKGGNKYG